SPIAVYDCADLLLPLTVSPYYSNSTGVKYFSVALVAIDGSFQASSQIALQQRMKIKILTKREKGQELIESNIHSSQIQLSQLMNGQDFSVGNKSQVTRSMSPIGNVKTQDGNSIQTQLPRKTSKSSYQSANKTRQDPLLRQAKSQQDYVKKLIQILSEILLKLPSPIGQNKLQLRTQQQKVGYNQDNKKIANKDNNENNPQQRIEYIEEINDQSFFVKCALQFELQMMQQALENAKIFLTIAQGALLANDASLKIETMNHIQKEIQQQSGEIYNLDNDQQVDNQKRSLGGRDMNASSTNLSQHQSNKTLNSQDLQQSPKKNKSIIKPQIKALQKFLAEISERMRFFKSWVEEEIPALFPLHYSTS
ncbi:MAG: hypothetical protein EZS28_049755, partial [Streblomastix strix]